MLATPTTNNQQPKPKGMIETSQISAVEKLSDAYDRKHLFQVVHSALLYIEADSNEVVEKWLYQLRTVCLANRVMHTRYALK